MRLIAWNVNHNVRRRPLEDSCAILEPLFPDVVVLSETAPPRAGNPLNALVVGDAAPVLAVVAMGRYGLGPIDLCREAPRLSAAFHVTGPAAFNLIAAWPVQLKTGPRYDRILNDVLDLFGSLALSMPTILAGDLNSSTRVASQALTHGDFVDKACSLGLSSVYHARTGERHGDETVPTYLHVPSGATEFHIDYCFVTRPLIDVAQIEVLRGADWASRSDHFPLVVDIPDRAFERAPL